MEISFPENILPDAEDVEPKTMSIGINNVFEVGCGTSSSPQTVASRQAASPESNLSLCLCFQCLRPWKSGTTTSSNPKVRKAPVKSCRNAGWCWWCWCLCSAEVGRNVILTSGCIVGACCQVNTCELIPENTVIYGSECLRRVQTERPQVTRRKDMMKINRGFILTLCLSIQASDAAAGLPDEDFAELPSSEENR